MATSGQCRLINGSYTGVDPDGGSDSDYADHSVGENAPEARIGTNVGWSLTYEGSYNGSNPHWFEGQYGHTITIAQSDGNETPGGVFLKPEEVFNIDSKVDDGMPARGKVVVQVGTGGTPDRIKCTESNPGADDNVGTGNLDAVYQLSYFSNACHVIFRNAL